ncbi:dynamin family protein [Paeniglutamicibacter sp. ABSL32-1]|uniref:dynamin family protein n=1 Tax=Paeniglutamicibacter quisquiliarum TaxID=2849498 RepID=UPI001C2D73CD|nr:dynamin family protein [Paeniglutamicibacter quisquiliarum]MBV1780751.1 dynamin family protein [Paeniglutamicibacter quisquiliarum]
MEAINLLTDVRTDLSGSILPLDIAGVTQARENARTAVEQLDDYILPRYRSLDAPLLAVVGGSTGAGKSTLVNAIVGHPVTRAGAIRPTTRQPILLHHELDRAWLENDRILPGLRRITGTAVSRNQAIPAAQVGATPDAAVTDSIILVQDDAVPRGLAILDAPDVDSISDENRRLAGQLLAAADLWIFVTTANRYADAVPWKLLSEAAGRNITVAVVLDRVPAGVEDEIATDLRGMLQREGLGSAELFVVPEVELDELDMLPAIAAAPLKAWLGELAANAESRAAIARQTLAGVLAQLADRSDVIATAMVEQGASSARLAQYADEAFEQAHAGILASVQDGTLLRGEVLARWQDFVGTGEFFRSLESGIGRLRDRIGAFFTGKPKPVDHVEEAIESGLHAVVVDQAAKASETTEERWRSDPAGKALVGTSNFGSLSPGFSDRVAEQVRAWQGDLMEIIRTEGANKRMTARMVSFGVNGVAVALMVVVFASTAGLTGLEVGIAGGSAVVGQKLLEAIFGEDAVRRLTKQAKDSLAARCTDLLETEKQRFASRLENIPSAQDADRMKQNSAAIRRLAREQGA